MLVGGGGRGEWCWEEVKGVGLGGGKRLAGWFQLLQREPSSLSHTLLVSHASLYFPMCGGMLRKARECTFRELDRFSCLQGICGTCQTDIRIIDLVLELQYCRVSDECVCVCVCVSVCVCDGVQ